MKKEIVILCFYVLGMTAFAQKGADVRLGMQLTPTLAWLSTDEKGLVEPDGAAMGYSFGLISDWFFSDNYAFATGVFMNAMGASAIYGDLMQIETKNDGLIDLDGQVTLMPTYLEVPLGFKFLTKEFNRTKFVGQCGYNQFVLLGAKLRQSDGVPDLDKKDIGVEFTKLMSAYHFGFGLEYALGGDVYLTASVLATMGLNDVTKSFSTTNIDPVNKLNSVNFKIGIIF